MRPGQNDHTVLQQLVVEGRAPTGFVFEARRGDRHHDLLQATQDAGLHTILDPNVQEMFSVGGRELAGISQLPWGALADSDVAALSGHIGSELIRLIVEDCSRNRYSSVLAPTHYLENATDTSFEVDVKLVRRLRGALDSAGLDDTRIYYPLALPATALSDASSRGSIVNRLIGLDIDAVWLRLHPFGTNAAGPVALRRYLTICSALRRLQIPIVGERTGTVGLALMAFGAVGGIECGVTLGERFDASRLIRAPRTGDPFAHPPMVYLAPIGQFVDRKVAATILGVRGAKAALGCRDPGCCRTGPDDMLRDPRRHGALQRIREVTEIADVPSHRRAVDYVEGTVRRGSDIAVRFASIDPSIERARKRLDSWRGILSAILEQSGASDNTPPAVGERLRRPPDARPRSL
ncbi:MAG: hypothetical protein M3406_15585 [Chloroflexota bacterium]|nr:hypothetical protein [Chloroflexota bacterium]